MSKPLFQTDCPDLKLISRGKVRDIYDLGDSLLIVTTDRISAFDKVMPTPVPDKGKILTQMTLFWLRFLEKIVPNHLQAGDVCGFPQACRVYDDQLRGRTMWVKKAEILPIECIVRGYLVGSGWKDYQKTGEVCGIRLPEGLQEAQQLPEPLFTPSTKAPAGEHDENISWEQMKERVGTSAATRVRELSLKIYKKAAAYSLEKGIILADTKFEFGYRQGGIILVDEALTPDSSRFWPADRYRVGCSPESFDKQYLRDYLKKSGWKTSDPPPELPPEVVEKTRVKYIEALDRLTGKKFEE